MAKSTARCWWCGDDPTYVHYHDTEWGVPVLDDRALFEKLVLDGFQAGLSWITVLRKKPAFVRAFKGFEPARVARFTQHDVARLLQDEGIIRSRAKINGAITNAQAWLKIMEDGPGAFRDFLWQHVEFTTQVNRFRERADIPAETPQSAAMAKALKKAGFTFCGPTICYAFMQAVGMTNDHLVSCFRHAPLVRAAVKQMPVAAHARPARAAPQKRPARPARPSRVAPRRRAKA
ncbi:MAG: DNA-3-methyladenine glycosylase I [Phycisphaerales bacterium]